MGIILNTISAFLRAVEILIIVECLGTWIIRDGNNEVMKFLKAVTEPILQPFRKIQDKYLGNLPFDFSPVFAILAIGIVEAVLYRIF